MLLLARFDQLAMFASSHHFDNFGDALEAFCKLASLSGTYFLADTTNMVGIARLLSHLPLSLEELFTFCISPASMDDPPVVQVNQTADHFDSMSGYSLCVCIQPCLRNARPGSYRSITSSINVVCFKCTSYMHVLLHTAVTWEAMYYRYSVSLSRCKLACVWLDARVCAVGAWSLKSYIIALMLLPFPLSCRLFSHLPHGMHMIAM